MSDYGFIYCLSNDAMPGVYKIEMTRKSPSSRCEQLSSTSGCAEPFEIAMYMEVENPDRYEKAVHRLLARNRKNENREFFECQLGLIKSAFEYLSDTRYPIAISNCALGEIAFDEYCGKKINAEFDWFDSEEFQALTRRKYGKGQG